MRLQVGDGAPDFELQDAAGKTWNLSDLRGQKVVLYFYPKDDTSGCTAQACDFRDARTDFDAAGFRVLGISPQGTESHRRFTDKYGLNFPLLIDEDHSVAASYGAWGRRKLYGKLFEGIIRSTFVIDEDGRVEQAQYDVKARGHVDRLRETLGV